LTQTEGISDGLLGAPAVGIHFSDLENGILVYFCHSGVGRYKSDIESWLMGKIPAYYLK